MGKRSGLNDRLPEFDYEHGGATYRAQVAKVESFHLGPEGHGLFTAVLCFEGAGWGQCLPAPILDDKAAEIGGERPGTAWGFDYIRALTGVVGSPEQAKGRRVVVFRDSGGFGGTIKGVAALNDDGSFDAPFFPADLAAKHGLGD